MNRFWAKLVGLTAIVIALGGCVMTYEDGFWLASSTNPLPVDAMVAAEESAYNVHFDGEKYVFVDDDPDYEYAKFFPLHGATGVFVLQLKNTDPEDGYYYVAATVSGNQMTVLGTDNTAAARSIGIADVRGEYMDESIQVGSGRDVSAVLLAAVQKRDRSKDSIYTIYNYAVDSENAAARLIQKALSTN